MEIRIAGIVNDSITDGPGLRLSVFFQGCGHHCSGCHNPQTHDMNGGILMDTEELLEIAKSNPLLRGVTLTGGEPFLQIDGAVILAKGAKRLGLDVIVYTGFCWEEITISQKMLELSEYADYIVDGKFVLEKKSLDVPFVGSTNQRIINVKKSLAQGFAVEEHW